MIDKLINNVIIKYVYVAHAALVHGKHLPNKKTPKNSWQTRFQKFHNFTTSMYLYKNQFVSVSIYGTQVLDVFFFH